MEKGNYNSTISVIRVVSMFSIVLGHLCKWGGVYTFQLGNLGVDIFLLISGFLYGNKHISNRRDFIFKRIERVILPFWILSFVLAIFLLLQGQSHLAFSQLIETGLNLQGISSFFVHSKSFNFHVDGLSHCWFLTVIMLCYILVALLKNTTLERLIDANLVKALFSTMIIHLLLITIGFNIRYIISYFIGYFYARAKQKGIPEKFYKYLTVVMIYLCGLRLITHIYIDGTMLYDNIICAWSFIVLGAWCCLTMDLICHRFRRTTGKVVNNHIWHLIDWLSYPIYLTHFMFLHDPFDVKFIGVSLILQTLAFFLLTFASAFVLMCLSDFVIYSYNKKMQYDEKI